MSESCICDTVQIRLQPVERRAPSVRAEFGVSVGLPSA